MADVASSDGDERYLDAPERFRTRSRSMAGLIATGAGAVAAGLVFSPRSDAMTATAVTAGLGTLILLLLSLIFFSWGSVYTKKGPNGESDLDASIRMSRRIRGLSRTGSGLAVAALAAFTVMVMAALIDDPAYVRVEVAVDNATHERNRQLCPALGRSFEGMAAPADLSGTAPMLPIRITAEACGNPAYPKMSRVLYIHADSATIATSGS